jgi:hypothetical protein
MILFDRSQRFYGADAASLLARKSHQTPAAMSVLLGRDEEHPVVQVRLVWKKLYCIQSTLYRISSSVHSFTSHLTTHIFLYFIYQYRSSPNVIILLEPLTTNRAVAWS